MQLVVLQLAILALIPPVFPHHLQSYEASIEESNSASILYDSVANPEAYNRRKIPFELARINKDVISAFKKAWSMAKNGTTNVESVVLIFRMLDGSYSARTLPQTNECRMFTFRWVDNAIAVVHTHPNTNDPRPQDEDKQLADKYRVPIFTITTSGMFVYDPAIKKTSQVHNGLDWLNPLKWNQETLSKLASAK